ncbi:hypothetical protein TD95_004925 [Thielaviopsis punctulata]|uniref:Uncharacterized protein n=1 Tax=Thielaviopsis punctulata TaxID=72032 RepID=A0A0F4ZB56_9PEZI|nr:hypothetical protein TD95_004925 [Thielaviopsis punctulata]
MVMLTLAFVLPISAFHVSLPDGLLPAIFTHSIESDFISACPISRSPSWIRPEFNITREPSEAELPESFRSENTFSSSLNAEFLANIAAGRRLEVGNVGVVLRVRGGRVDGMVSTSEMDSKRNDVGYGSFRVGLKLSREPGTCAAFFWYHDDAHEIDIEFLSREFDAAHSIFPLHFVVHSLVSPIHLQANLSFDPTTAFHEYRFDYIPGHILFYVDGMLIGRATQREEMKRGVLVVQHWSNGNVQWTAGPPERDADMAVSYVKAYFNGSGDVVSGAATEALGGVETEVPEYKATEYGAIAGPLIVKCGCWCGSNTLKATLRNDTDVPLFFTITGLALQRANAPVFICADGKTPYYPPSPPDRLQPVTQDVAIRVAPGASQQAVIPRIAGGRVWFCKNTPLVFFVNPGPAVVEPSTTNTTDKNYYKDWGFAEFTFNEHQLFANISHVDFVSIPASLDLHCAVAGRRCVPGMPADGLDRVCRGLLEQEARDGAGWAKLVVRGRDGGFLRALSPNAGAVMHTGLFKGYLEGYIEQVWKTYETRPLVINTQAQWGDVQGRVVNGVLDLGVLGRFERPATADVFSCSTGPFARGPGYTEGKGAAGARLAAALNRGTLLRNDRQPEGEAVEEFYAEEKTNHYARICHEVSREGRGYAFPYDDVGSSQGVDQSGAVWGGSPEELVVGVGGC